MLNLILHNLTSSIPQRKHPLNYADYAELQSPGAFLTSHGSFVNRTSSSDVRGDQIILQVQDHPHHQMMDLTKTQYQAMEAMASQATTQPGDTIYSTYIPSSTETGVTQVVSMHGMTYSADASSTTHLRRSSYGDKQSTATSMSSTPQHSINGADIGSNHISETYPKKMDSKSWFLLLMADTMLPPSIVANPNFKGFVRSLNPNFSLPSEEVFTLEWIPQRQELLKRHIHEQLLDVERVCIVVTKLISSTQQHLVNFSACFVKHWNFRRVLLACRIFGYEPQSDTICHIIDELQTEYQLEGKILQRLIEEDVSDFAFPGFSVGSEADDRKTDEADEKPYRQEGSNMGDQWLTSFQQDLQVCISDGLKDIQQVFDCVQNVLQTQRGDAVNGTASPESDEGEIRGWLNQVKFLKAVMSSSQASEQERLLLNELFDTLEPFEDAMDYIGKHKDNIPISFAIPCIRGLQRHLKCVNQSSCQKLLFQLKAGLIKKMSKFESSRMCKLAAVLDPRFKVTWCSQQEVSSIKDILLKASIDMAERLNFYGAELSHSEEVDEDAGNTSKLFKLMGSPQQNKPNFQEVKVQEEVNNYLSLPCSKNNANPLHYWKFHGAEFPLLSLLACNTLCIPAASLCKNDFIQGLENNLPHSTMERLMFIRINSTFF